MSTGTTSPISDSELVNLAKQQYDQKQKSKIPSVVVNLTSKGKVYPESHPLRQGFVNMRHMTAYDEDIIVNESYIEHGIMFDVLLAELITDDIAIEDIATVDRDGLIINARRLGYGDDYPVSVINPKTGATVNTNVKLSNLLVKDFNLEPDENGEFEYSFDADTKIKFRYRTNRQIPTDDPDKKISNYLKSIITEVNGDRDVVAIENFIKYNLSPINSKKFRKYYSEVAPSIITDIKVTGEDGDTFTAGFQFDTGLFW